MTVLDQAYCVAVAGSDRDACQAWLQAGRDHRWSAGGTGASLLPTVVLLVVAAAALWVAVRALRSTRPTRTAVQPPPVGPTRPGAAATAPPVPAAGTRWRDSAQLEQDGRAEAHNGAGPTSW